MKSGQGKIIILIFLTLLVLPGMCQAENSTKPGGIFANEDLFEGFVYFADDQKTGLKSVKMRFASTLNSHDLGREIIRSLVAGPSVSSLRPVWPAGTEINAFFIADDGKAYVDLSPGEGMVENMDTQSELLAIYSLVNSLTLNIPEIKKVKLLIQGNDALTLAGHIDLEYFYQTNMLIVK